MVPLGQFAAIRINLASPQDIRSWSSGEVKTGKTIDRRSGRPVRDGLLCQRIFGPTTDWQCACGRYRGKESQGVVCEDCGVEVADSRVRGRRMGHIELAAPVVHIWFFKTLVSRLSDLLDMTVAALEKIIYFRNYVVIDPGGTPLAHRQLLTEDDLRTARERYGEAFEAEIGAAAIKTLLQRLDLAALSRQLRDELQRQSAGQKPWWRYPAGLVRRLATVETLRDSGNRPEWMVLECIPVIPPDLRRLAGRTNGNVARGDLDRLYRNVIRRNNRLKEFAALDAPGVILRNEKRRLQQAVDRLLDNRRCNRPARDARGRRLDSLTDLLDGRRGAFCKAPPAKRVDYSARLVVVPGPELKLHQCGLPKKIALELFRPFVVLRLMELGHAGSIESAGRMLDRPKTQVWNALADVSKNHPVLLSRSPVLNRAAIQALQPVPADGGAVRVHPLIWQSLGGEFGGEPAVVQLPFSTEAQAEAAVLMMPGSNLFSPATGRPNFGPSRDVVLGCCYLTLAMPRRKGEGMTFASTDEVELAWSLGKVEIHAAVKVRLPRGRSVQGRADLAPGSIIETTVGRVLFNSLLPESMPYYNRALRAADLDDVIADCWESAGRRATIDLLENVNRLGCRAATQSGLSLAAADLLVPPAKQQILAEAEKKAAKRLQLYARQIITEGERYNQVLDAWTSAREQITTEMMKGLEDDHRSPGYVNPLYLMAHSGACCGVEQIRQLCGMGGLRAKPWGRLIEIPVKSNFREGLSVPEYLISMPHGTRRELAGAISRTAKPAYLTRKLADAAGHIVVTMHDCGTAGGATKGAVYRGENVLVSLAEAIEGRASCARLVHPVSGEVIVYENEMITRDQARRIEELGIGAYMVRSPLSCQARRGVCRLCYGADPATGTLVELGTAVGVIAAQSVGELGVQPGLQPVKRWNRWQSPLYDAPPRHAYEYDVNEVRAKRQGMARLARTKLVRSETGEDVVLGRDGEILIVDRAGRELENYPLPFGASVLVADNQEVAIGEVLCRWDARTAPILAERGGRVRFDEIVEGYTVGAYRDPGTGRVWWEILEHVGNVHPRILVEDRHGRVLAAHYLPEKAILEVRDGQAVSAGALLAKTPRRYTFTTLAGDLPPLMQIFEARRPPCTATLAEIDGIVRLREAPDGRFRTVYVENIHAGADREHRVPRARYLSVRDGDYVRAGQPLDNGLPSPHDILRILGTSSVERHLLEQLQATYRRCYARIDDKHLELLLAEMLRRQRVQSGGHTPLVPGTLVDRVWLQSANGRLRRSVKIEAPGDSKFTEGQIVNKKTFDRERARLESEGKTPPTCTRPLPAVGVSQLLGITRVGAIPESFLAAATIRDAARVLTEAALAGKVDRLAGLKENVLLGRLIPAGTGFIR